MSCVYVEFDGVLHSYDEYKNDENLCTPLFGIETFLKSLFNQVDEIILHSDRKPEVLDSWLRSYGLRKYFCDITNKMPSGAMYIGSRAFQFKGNFKSVLKQIKNFKVYWDNG